MGRLVATFGGVVVLGLLAGAATEATIALGHAGSLSNDILLRPGGAKTAATASPSPTVSPSTSPSVSPSASPQATQVPTPTAGPTATTNAFVHLRSDKSTSSAIITDLNGGTVVQLLSDSDAQWQQVSYNGQTGYIFKTYLAY